MKRIAVIGSGISGMAAAYYLSRRHEVTLFEKESRLGGHTHTVRIGGHEIDTGFIVHNAQTYPNLIRLFAELGVATAPSDMSFSVSDRRTGFEYSSKGLNGFFACRSNALSPLHHKLLWEILRFNRVAPQLLAEPGVEHITLGSWLRQHAFHEVFLERYLYPMASAVWSMPLDLIAQFPALTLIRFFHNHGMLGIDTHPKWRVVTGGSNRYIAPLVAPCRERIHLNSTITSATRLTSGVLLRFSDRAAQNFDEVVFATHGNQVLPLLSDPTDAEIDVLRSFETSRNEVCLHTDQSLLPVRRRAWAAWNYNLTGSAAGGAAVTYYMNRLQSLATPVDYCVTLNASSSIQPEKILRRMVYYHPLYTAQAIAAQRRWSRVSGVNNTHYCGAYWFYGFHEDGLNSALRVAKTLGIDC